MSRKSARNNARIRNAPPRIYPIESGFHLRFEGHSYEEIQEALNEVNACLKDPFCKSVREVLREEKPKLISLLEKAREREREEIIASRDMNQSRKDICRPERRRRGGWLVQGGFTDGHGKVDRWRKDE